MAKVVAKHAPVSIAVTNKIINQPAKTCQKARFKEEVGASVKNPIALRNIVLAGMTRRNAHPAFASVSNVTTLLKIKKKKRMNNCSIMQYKTF